MEVRGPKTGLLPPWEPTSGRQPSPKRSGPGRTSRPGTIALAQMRRCLNTLRPSAHRPIHQVAEQLGCGDSLARAECFDLALADPGCLLRR